MGVQEVGREDELINQDNITIGELKEIFGREATRRGLEYMNSLTRADRNYREAANPDDLDEGFERAYDVEEVETNAAEDWASSMEKKGLDIDD